MWMSSGSPPELWPRWLVADIPDLAVWSYEHDSSPSLWRGWSMPLVDRATNALATLLAEERLREGEISFVTHSFGGLIFEQLLRTASDRAANETELADLTERIRRVIFIGTPHFGADLATWSDVLRLMVRPSSATKGLSRNDPNLRGLNHWFRQYSLAKGIAARILTESRPTRFGLIVKADSSDPGLPAIPIPVDADHFGIAAPEDRASDVYVQILDFLRAPLLTNVGRQVMANNVIGVLTDNTGRSAAALERIEHILSVGAFSEKTQTSVPAYLVDAETSKRITRLRKMRFFGGSTHLEEASRLAEELKDGGELQASSIAVKAHALAWCARLLLGRSDRSEAVSILSAARDLASTDEIRIAEAFYESYEGRQDAALGLLSSMQTPAARSASFMIASNTRDAVLSLDWLKQSGLKFSDLDSDGKFFVLKKQLGHGMFSEALANAVTLVKADFDMTPVLLYVAGGAHLAKAIPEELASLILWHLPFDAASVPLFEDPASMTERRTAKELYVKASEVALELGCIQASEDAEDRALWLGLRDTAHQREARAELESSMRDASRALRRLPLALDFGLKLDLDAIELEIDRQENLSGGTSSIASIARFSIAQTKKSPREIAAYIDKHRTQLLRNLNPLFVASVEIQALSQSGQIDLAEARFKELSGLDISEQERARLLRIIEEGKGSNAIEVREKQFANSGALTDLANLVELLRQQNEWGKLVNYGKLFFERTRDLAGCTIFAQSLFETEDFENVVKLLRDNSELVGRSLHLQALLAWSLYRCGNLLEARAIVAQLRSSRDHSGDRILFVNITISSGDWTSLASFVEGEWEKRSDRGAEDLLRAGQLAQQIGSARAKDLIFEAAAKAGDDATILVGCYSTVVTAGWENEETAGWLQRGAALSGDDGPIKRVSLKEISELHPNWQQRESKTWEGLHRGELPIFTAGHLLNRSLLDLYLLPALSSSEEVDPRRRHLLYAFSGARGGVNGTPKKALFDPSALLTLGVIGAIEDAFNAVEAVVLPHNTLGWLFEEKQKVAFHQPSRIKDAREIKRLLDDRAVQNFEGTASPDADLAAEVGDELAALIAETEGDFGDDKRQRLVVRSAPVHRIGSFLEEAADLDRHAAVVCGCLDVVEALARQGQLTRTEEERARAYLALQEKPWPHPPSIRPGALLYLDELSVSYFQHLRLLPKFHAAGFTCIIPRSEMSRGKQLLAYDNLLERGASIIENVRRICSEGIINGRIQLAPEVRTEDEAGQDGNRANRSFQHPTLDILEAGTRFAHLIVVDDRYFNQHAFAESRGISVPVLTTFDLLTISEMTDDRRRDCVTAMRRAGLAFIPTSAVELTGLLERSRLEDGRLIETVELRALRENVELVRMSTGLQLPAESPWFDNLIRSMLTAVRLQWSVEIEDEVSRARSKWLLELLDIRKWANHYRVDGNPEIVDQRFRGQILALSTMVPSAAMDVRDRYWLWLQEAVLAELKMEQPELFAGVVQQAREVIEGVANASAKDG
jgi:hypothetical protein